MQPIPLLTANWVPTFVNVMGYHRAPMAATALRDSLERAAPERTPGSAFLCCWWKRGCGAATYLTAKASHRSAHRWPLNQPSTVVFTREA
jgi:hypothetical protein